MTSDSQFLNDYITSLCCRKIQSCYFPASIPQWLLLLLKLEVLKMTFKDFLNLITHHLYSLLQEHTTPFSFGEVLCSVLLLLLLGTLIIICNLVIICGFVCFTPVVPVCRVMEAETPSTSLTIVYLGISMRSGSEHLLDKNMHVINF